MWNVLLLQKIHDAGMELLRSRRDVAVTCLDGVHHDERDVIANIRNAHAVTIRKAHITDSILAAANNLVVVSKHGVGVDNIDLEAATERGVVIVNAPDELTTTVAEAALTMIFALGRQSMLYDRSVRNGDLTVRESLIASDIAGKSVLVIGFGRVGREVARLCRAVGLVPMAYDPLLPSTAFASAGCQHVVDFRDALKVADFVCVNCPLTPDTRHMIGADELGLMRPSAVLVNISRGGVVDEKALYLALAEHRLKGAGLDVFEGDFPRLDNPLLKLDNVLLSPHSAALTEDCARRLAVASVRNALAVLDGDYSPAMVVNKAVLDSRNLRAPAPRGSGTVNPARHPA